MDDNCARPCRELKELEGSFDRFREETGRRLAAGDISMATINTKLNWLIAVLSAVGVALLGTITSLLF